MLNVTLQCSDSIATVLPAVEQAMHSGDVCRIHNINYLGQIHTAALALLAKSRRLLDATSGQVVEAQPGFCLLAVDEYGVTRVLAT